MSIGLVQYTFQHFRIRLVNSFVVHIKGVAASCFLYFKFSANREQSPVAAQAQSIQKVIDKYSSDERFTYVAVGSGLIDLGMSFLGDKVEGLNKKALSKLKSVRVLTLESETEGKIMKSLVDDLTKAIRADSEVETLVESRDKGETTNIYFTSEGLLIVTKDAKELTVVCILGDISKKWIQELVSKNK